MLLFVFCAIISEFGTHIALSPQTHVAAPDVISKLKYIYAVKAAAENILELNKLYRKFPNHYK